MKPVVKILVSCPDPAWIDACTWVFPPLRVGFPTSEIQIFLNQQAIHESVYDEIYARALAVQGIRTVYRVGVLKHHADWVREEIEIHDTDAPLVILDADTYFHSSVEDWSFNTLMAGYLVPEMYNDFAKCPSLPRLHTSFLWFQDVKALRAALREVYPQAHDKTGPYSPCDPYMPAVKFCRGLPIFWDTCATMFHMLCGRYPMTYFGKDQTDCYEHLNSAAFFDTMKARVPDPVNFERLHRELLKEPEALRGRLWATTAEYYRRKAEQLNRQ